MSIWSTGSCLCRRQLAVDSEASHVSLVRVIELFGRRRRGSLPHDKMSVLLSFDDQI